MGPFAGQSLDAVSLEDLKRLIDNAVPEGLHLDYKRELTLDDRDEKKEFLRDLTAFANAEGGMIIYGVDEERDSAGKPTGLPKSLDGFAIPNRDAFVLAVEQIIKDGIDERLPSCQVASVPIADSRHVLMIRVPASLRAPHMVTLAGERRFFIRGNSGKQDMSTALLRDSVLRTESAIERIRAFVDQRVAKFGAVTQGRPYWMLHVIPLVRTSHVIDVTDPKVIDRLRRIQSPHGGNSTHTIDGYKLGRRDSDGSVSHSLVFRDGTLEFMEQDYFTPQGDGVVWLAYAAFDALLFKLLGSSLELYREGHIQLPAVVAVTLQGTTGTRLPAGRVVSGRSMPIEENRIAPEPRLMTEIPVDTRAFLKPVLDYIWNAYGFPRCPGYDNEGKYIGYP